MNALNERIESSTVSVHTPNELVFGEARGEREVRVWFAPGHHQQVSTRKLEDELATLARLLFVAGVGEHGVALKEATGRTFINRPMIGRRDVAYVERLETLAAEGRSDDGTVQVTSVGQVSYAVPIVPGTLDRAPQQTFEASCGQAANRLLVDVELQAAAARWEIYEPIPGVVL